MKKFALFVSIMLALGFFSVAFAGFELENEDASLNIGGYMRTGFFYGQNDDESYDAYSSSSVDDTTTFFIQNARVVLKGQVLEYVKFNYTIDFAPGSLRNPVLGNEISSSSSSSTKDAYIQFIPVENLLNIRIGKFLTPFGLCNLTSTSKLQFVKTNLATDLMTWGRDVGLMLDGAYEEGMFEYALGIFNGDGGAINPDNKFLFAMRVGGGYSGEYMGKYDEVDSERHEEFYIRGGLSFAMNQQKTYVGADEDSNDMTGVGGDITVKWIGLSFVGEVIWNKYTPAGKNPDGSDLDDVPSLGWYAQFGYLFEAFPIEPAFRFDYYDWNTDAETEEEFQQYAYTFGVNYYMKKHDAKIQLNYVFNDENYGYENAEDCDNDELYILTQIVF